MNGSSSAPDSILDSVQERFFARWPWRMALASYACLVLMLIMGFMVYSCCVADILLPLFDLVFSLTCLTGLMLLVGSAVLAAVGLCRKPTDVVNFAVLLVTLPPLVLHVLGALSGT